MHAAPGPGRPPEDPSSPRDAARALDPLTDAGSAALEHRIRTGPLEVVARGSFAGRRGSADDLIAEPRSEAARVRQIRA